MTYKEVNSHFSDFACDKRTFRFKSVDNREKDYINRNYSVYICMHFLRFGVNKINKCNLIWSFGYRNLAKYDDPLGLFAFVHH